MLLLAVRLRWIIWDISHSFVLRLAITVFTIVLIYTVAQVNVFTCRSDLPCPTNVTLDAEPFEGDHRSCPLPQYIVLSCALGYLAVAIFLRLPILLKASLLIIMSTVYILLIELSHIELFLCYDKRVSSIIPAHVLSVVEVLMFVLAVLLHGRQVEWTARLDFLWQVQANEEKREMDALQHSNKRILFNLLPAHVATHFLERQLCSNMNTLSQELYHQSYSRVGVVFASITNYHEFYTELDGNNQGVECLRLLNEIIADFDDLLSEERFKAIDKIKTVGSTYMAAVGLMPDLRILDDDETTAGVHLCTLVEFVFAMRDRLLNINENSYNNFMLRVGINVGPVVAGVIGARKPQYDIWGNTVNVASRMDSTGLPNHTQVTEEVYQILKNYPYEFQCRGKVKVKGKGDMTTYFLIDRKQPGTLRVDELNSLRSNSNNTQNNSINSMYGGVATPLALLHHNDIINNGRQQKHCLQQQNRSMSRAEDNYSIKNVAMRLPPLRETPITSSSSSSQHHQLHHHHYHHHPGNSSTNNNNNQGSNNNNGCENEPLLPSTAFKGLRNGKNKQDESLPPPPLPPHKNGSYQMVSRPLQDMKYTPPWPRAPNPYTSIQPSLRSNDNVKPYLKPLPKPPGKESPNKQHRKHTTSTTSTPPPPPHQRTPELLRNKLQTQRHSPLHQRHHSPHHQRHSPLLQRHYSDESLGGLLYTTTPPQRIHSSADEISSLNHSPSISSSDESYSRTTDADASPCVSPPLPITTNTTAATDTQQFLFPSDIQVNPCSSPEISPRASLDYIPANCSLRNNNNNNNNNNHHNINNNTTDRLKRNNLPPNAILALAGTCNTVDSNVTSPPILDGEDSYRGGESCTSFEFTRPKIKSNGLLLRNGSNNGGGGVSVGGSTAGISVTTSGGGGGAISRLPIKQKSLDKRMVNEINCKRSPSFKDALITNDELLKNNCDDGNEKTSLKKDGSCQTDKKDLRRFKSGIPQQQPQNLLKSPSSSITSNKLINIDDHNDIKIGPFEREIQKLLDEQNLLQNIPSKFEYNPQNKDICLEPLTNTSNNSRYGSGTNNGSSNNNSNNTNNNNNNNHQVGLAAIQALALGLRVNPTGSVTLQCMSPPRASSKEGSIKRGTSPGFDMHKQPKMSPMDRTHKPIQDVEDCDKNVFPHGNNDDDTDLESFEREERLMEEEAAKEEEVKRLLEEKVQEKLRNLENGILDEQLLTEHIQNPIRTENNDDSHDDDDEEDERGCVAVGSSGDNEGIIGRRGGNSESKSGNNEDAEGGGSQSEWSEDEDGGASEPLLNDRESTGYTTDDPALENISMINETGLTDAEGALSDVNSAYNDHNHEGDMDDNTSMSSRASSRIFDSDAMMSLDSLSALYDSEYDNCYRTDDDLNTVPDLDRLNYFSVPANEVHLANIRSMSESITRNFGQPPSETDPDSDV